MKIDNNIKNKIINKATQIGFQKIGFAEAKFYKDDQEKLDSWLDNNYHATMEWINKRKEERSNILKYFPEVKTVMSFGFNYFSGRGSDTLSDEFKFSNYAWGDDYHIVIKKRLHKILDEIKQNDDSIDGLVCVDTSPVTEKVWAQRAGIGWIGKHTNLITREYSSWLFLGVIIINLLEK